MRSSSIYMENIYMPNPKKKDVPKNVPEIVKITRSIIKRKRLFSPDGPRSSTSRVSRRIELPSVSNVARRRRSIPEDIENVNILESSLGQLSCIISPEDVLTTEVRSFMGATKYTSVRSEMSFYNHNLLQYNQEAYFKELKYKKVSEFSIDENSISEPKMMTIPCSLDKNFLAYHEAIIFYESENENPEDRIVVSVCVAYDGRAVYYNVYSHSSTQEIWENWLAYSKENNFYRGQKIDASCNFLRLNKNITWDNVILPERIRKVICHNIHSLYNNREVLAKNNISIKRGVILTGVPGVGKTMVCKIICQELPITVLYVLPSDIRDVCDLSRICDMAQDLAPTLLILEDIDYIAEQRDDHSGSWLTIELMNRLDGLEEMKGVITVATTNLINKLENAIKNRPGRFDKVIKIPLPDGECRKRMINKFTGRFILAEDVNIDELVKSTKSMPGAYICHVCDYAAILAIEEGSIDENQIAKISMKHFQDALDEIKDKDFGTVSAYEANQRMGFHAGDEDD